MKFEWKEICLGPGSPNIEIEPARRIGMKEVNQI